MRHKRIFNKITATVFAAVMLLSAAAANSAPRKAYAAGEVTLTLSDRYNSVSEDMRFSGRMDNGNNTIAFVNATASTHFGMLEQVGLSTWTLNMVLNKTQSGEYEGNYTIDIAYDLSSIRDNANLEYWKAWYEETTSLSRGSWSASRKVSGTAKVDVSMTGYHKPPSFYYYFSETSNNLNVNVQGISLTYRSPSYYYADGSYSHSERDAYLAGDEEGLYFYRTIDRYWGWWAGYYSSYDGSWVPPVSFNEVTSWEGREVEVYWSNAWLSPGWYEKILTLQLSETESYKVTFDADGGTPVPSAQTVAEGEKAKAPADPAKQGYVFLGWYRGETKWDFANSTVTSDVALKAKWEKCWTVTFDTDGGTAAPPAQTVKNGEKAAKPPDPGKEGHAFQGWFDGNTKWDFNNAVTKDITLKAKWEGYVVTFDADGGWPEPSRQRVAAGGKAKAPAPPERTDGLSFGGWYNGDKKWDFDKDTVTKDVTLKARWGYKVDFDTDGGSAVPQQVIPPGQKAVKPADPKKDGYVLTGWYREVGFLKEKQDWDFDKDTVAEDIVLKAKWEEGWVVKFNADGGAPVPADQAVKKDGKSKVTAPPKPAKEGYALIGWYYFDGSDRQWDFEKDTVKDDMTLKAKWGEAWTVTFDADGGKPVPAKLPVLKGARIMEIPKDPAKNGYIFAGWYNGGVKWNFAADAVTANITLKAKWEEGWTVAFDADGGTPVPPNQTVKKDGTGKAAAVAKPQKDGLIFLGWYNGGAKWDFDNYTVTSDITLKARWDTGWTVTFDADGGTPVPPNQTVEKGTLFKAVSDPKKEGYTFDGWYYNDYIKWDFNTSVANGDIVLRAKWQQNGYKVKFNANGGWPQPADQKVTGDPFSLSPPPDNGRAKAPDMPGKAGYMFTGWYDENDRLWNFNDVVTRDMKLKAKYVKISAVTADPENGDEPKKTIVISGGYVSPPETPSQDGKLFDGWYGENGDLWDFGNGTADGDVTLTAKWKDIPEGGKFRVTFDAAGGRAAPAQQSAPEGGKLTPLPDPERDGYIFLGWYLGDKLWDFDNDALTAGAAPAAYMLNAAYAASGSGLTDIILVAKWQRIDGWYTAVFDTDGGGAAPAEQTARVNRTLSYVLPPEKDGYVFLGWYNGGKLWDFDNDIITADITLTAKWQKNDTVTGAAAPAKADNGWWIALICIEALLAAAAGFAVCWFAVKKKSLGGGA